MKQLVYIVFLFLTQFALGQSEVDYLNEKFTADTIVRSIKTHTGLLPNIRLNSKEGGNYMSISALGDLNYVQGANVNFKAGLGGEFKLSAKEKWFVRLAAVQGIHDLDSIFVPKTFIRSVDKKTNLYTDIRSRVSFTPNQIFNFQAGVDHNFIGEGLRSMMLSDYGTPYPFAMIRTRFWRIEYSVLYQFMREGQPGSWESKFNASHHISFNATKWLNFGIFETVIFQPKDTLLNRGFEVEYLNPVIFYRPQEYSLGSSDNVLLGASFSAHYKKQTLYGQIMLDEFFLEEIRNKSGWWANKYGGQLGFKGEYNILGQNVFYRVEYNFARPYTYSHINGDYNYGNQGQTLTHPYGANFMEGLVELKWQHKKWKAKLFANYFLRGLDDNGVNYGANIYNPYTTRPEDYDHFIGRGYKVNGSVTNIMAAYELTDFGNLNVFVEGRLSYIKQTNNFNPMLVVGVRSLLWNDYRNY